MKTILCYGDSITWGYIPGNLGRLPLDQRWPSVLARALGPDYEVITEGLRGRYTVHDEPFRPGRSGADLLQPILESHAPVDLLILLLGTNDVLHFPELTAYDAARGIETLCKLAQASEAGPDGGEPRILLIAPPRIGKLSDELSLMCHGKPEHALDFARHYRSVAGDRGLAFLDAAEVTEPSPVDGVHLDAQGQRRLGEAVARAVLQIFSHPTALG